MAKPPSSAQPDVAVPESQTNPACGIIMPIASMPDYSSDHWATVREVISRAITTAELEPVAVWLGGSSDVLHERIVLNLYELPIAVCDISAQNPNVMLELGLRLAFGKPTIIVTDERLRAPFDIGSIEYVPYDKSLHILNMESFIARLAEKIIQVRDQQQAGTYRAFIKTFGKIIPGSLGEEGVPLGKIVLDELAQLRGMIQSYSPALAGNRYERDSARIEEIEVGKSPWDFSVPMRRSTEFASRAMNLSGVRGATVSLTDKGATFVRVVTGTTSPVHRNRVRASLLELAEAFWTEEAARALNPDSDRV